MFNNIQKYLNFFKDAKKNNFPLIKGKLPKVTFLKYKFTILFAALFILYTFFGFGLIPNIFYYYFTLGFAYFSFRFIALISGIVLLLFFIFTTYSYLKFKNNELTTYKKVLRHYLIPIKKFLCSPVSTIKFLISLMYKPTSLIKPLPSDKFSLFLGKSSGLLAKLWHTTSLAPNQNVFLDINDASKNILALGGIGSGKTSAVMQPLLLQLLAQNCGGLIFDIKGDVKDSSLKFAKHTNHNITLIGPDHSKINLLAGLSPSVAASFLKSSLLTSGSSNLDLFWIDTASELSRNVLGLLSFIPKFYTLSNLYSYIFDPDATKLLNEKLASVKHSLPPEQRRLFDVYHKYKSSIFDAFDDKVKSGVKATLAQALSPFNHPSLSDAFCSSDTLKIEDILSGSVFLVDMPISTWGLAAKVAYTFIKLRFFNLMQKNHNAHNRTLPVFFMCDEFQEIVSCNKDGLSDLNFWDKSRSSKTIGIISAQSISSFFAATPSRDYAYALLQNFRNKICLSTEDPLTIEYLSKLTGMAKTRKKSFSFSFQSSSSQTISEARDHVLEAQVFRSLSPDSALAILSIDNKSSDDALKLFPIFLEDKNSNSSNEK